jgi:hypothetical protein
MLSSSHLSSSGNYLGNYLLFGGGIDYVSVTEANHEDYVTVTRISSLGSTVGSRAAP